MAFIEIESLVVCYGRTAAVKGVSFQVPQGEVFGFIGPNGAGKTTTIKALATLLKPASGRARVGGFEVRVQPDRVRQIIGYMPDVLGLYDELTVNEYLHFFAAAYRLDPDRCERVVNDVLTLTDLGGKRHARIDELSRGMQQRLSLARVLLNDPQCLLLDEPASNLDPRARIEIREILKELQNLGKTILISSHILHELAQLCTRIGIIEAGRMVAQGSLEEIYRTLGLVRVIHVQVANQTPELLEQIRKLDGVVAVAVEVDRLAIQIQEDKLPVVGLADRLHGLGAQIYMFQPQAMDLETAFMKLTQGKTA
ncbi:MAG: multidrug ABC transporter ATP-binding protein [Lentisphaerae bacterium RIFOXYB12_FULL_65_16]|nr:MAG: multidrug ABC transporter ATP-binding protein [Lentisphaerae bacterium RIFOXYA12_64_32]OGV92349.1 MAG: multidrug ABC transporter ATP-binding protein [Lentisphaerae bacterium RIFOXYB12_FULL_65_16]